MIPLILSVGSAALFLGLSMSVYGADVLAQSAWVSLVFFGLIASGLVVYLISRPMPAWLCRLRERLGSVGDRCDSAAPCHAWPKAMKTQTDGLAPPPGPRSSWRALSARE